MNQKIVLGSKSPSIVSSPNRFSLNEEPRKSLSIEDLKNVNRTLLRSCHDYYTTDNQSDENISLFEETDDNGGDFQLELGSCRHSSISTVEDLSNRVKSELSGKSDKINPSCSNGVVKTQIKVGFVMHKRRAEGFMVKIYIKSVLYITLRGLVKVSEVLAESVGHLNLKLSVFDRVQLL